ncbi:MAG: ATP-dependent metallopeptidase FtsH/Yme1/Tma family protein, partial [Verrucomicrobia bacterium]|nr:ATP-dependent metallopeptidase FtsH/Yme1/Tma family protein [Verrucomicrobiota bacterium]
MKREPRITLPMKKPANVGKVEPPWWTWIWYFLGTLLVLWVWQELGNQVEFRTIPYSEFRTYLKEGIVTEAVVRQNEVDGRIVPKQETSKPGESATPSPSLGTPASPSPPTSASPSPGKEPFYFRTERLEDPGLVNELQAAGVQYSAARPGVISQF